MATRYVDFSAAFDGDGTDAAQAASGGAVGAWNTIIGKSISNGDVLWLRRASTALTTAVQLAFAGASYIGWPRSTDVDYGSRPASGQSAGWDADSGDYAEIRSTLATATGLGAFAPVGLSILKRLKLNHTATSNTNMGFACAISMICEARYCYFKTAVQGNASFSCVIPTSSGTKMYSCIIEAADQAACMLDSATLMANYFYDCTFRKVSPFVSSTYVVKTGGNSFSRCTFVDQSTGTSSCPFQVTASNTYMPGPALMGCTIDNSLATTFSKRALEVLGRAWVRSCTVLGTGFSHAGAGCPPLHICKMTQSLSLPSNVAFQVSAPGAVVKVDDCSFASGNQNDVALGPGVILMMTNTTFRATTPIRQDDASAYVYLRDEGGLSGNWRSLQNDGDVTTSTTSRTGGETFSLLMTKQDSSPAYVPIELFGMPGFETVYAALNPGSNTVTIYCSHKNFESDVPTADDVWFEFDYLDAGTGPSRATATTKATTALTSDASTWVGDTVTGFKLVKTLSVTQGQVVGIRVYSSKFHLTGTAQFGAIYVDPKIVVA